MDISQTSHKINIKTKNLSIPIIIAIEGFVSIAVEIICMRQLVQFVGNSVQVTSIIIGAFLLGLAYGYKRGAEYIGSEPSLLFKNFLIASLLL